MAINKAMRAALWALSYPDIDIKKNYKLHRQAINWTHYHYLAPLYHTWDHKVPCGDHEINVRIFHPTGDVGANDSGFSILLFFHGGGWVTGNIDSYDKVCSNMAVLTGNLVVSVDYQLAPENKFPAGLLDCYTVAREIFLDTQLLDTPVANITLVGDSAGGNLAAAVSLMARDRGEFLPQKQILLYPATYNDHTEYSPFESIRENGVGYLLTSKKVCDYLELYLDGKKDWDNPYFAPLLAKDLSGQPDTLIITAEFDPLRDEGEAYARELERAGNRVELHRIPDALHGFFSLPPSFPQVRDCYGIINRFLEEEPEIEKA